MKYLITGGAGFIGSHLTEKLVARGDQVTVLDNFSSSSLENLKLLENRIEILSGTVLNSELISAAVESCDYVVNLAAVLGVFNIIGKPLESLKVNLLGTQNVLEVANRHRKPVLIASSSEIYGKNDKLNLNEEDDRVIGHPLLSRWAYSEAKALDESLSYFYFKENKLPIRIVRFFNTVGPRQIGEYGMVLPRFVSAALKNDPLYVYGSGDQIRCFCHVTDAVKALLLVMDSEKAVGQVFNVGNNSQISILQLATKVIEITGSKSSIEKIAYEKAYPEGFEDMQRRVPDISKIKQVLGWEPEINLDQIIKDIAAFNTK
jgi:UDP-glucose 4-epimerase